MKKALYLVGLLTLTAGCTSFVAASGQNKVITTITQRSFGVNISTANANNQTPQITLGLITTTVQFMPLSTNSPLNAPNYASTFELLNNASPFTFDGNEAMAAGQDAAYALAPVGTTNSVIAAQPQNNR